MSDDDVIRALVYMQYLWDLQANEEEKKEK